MDADEITKIDARPNPARPALTGISVQTIAEAAARTALGIAADRPKDRPRAAIEARAHIQAATDRVRPVHDDDETPDAWYRRGVADGIVCAWGDRIHAPPTDIQISDLELYSAGYSHAASVVLRIRDEVRRGR
jgi:hypothetical protein